MNKSDRNYQARMNKYYSRKKFREANSKPSVFKDTILGLFCGYLLIKILAVMWGK